MLYSEILGKSADFFADFLHFPNSHSVYIPKITANLQPSVSFNIFFWTHISSFGGPTVDGDETSLRVG